ncbi:triose phosphate/phosphate translocator, putative [Babesia bigemina]|uniref:Triose phosphate/phosphate translocator, putative n=1 Tax=Babesia bigemina TaxID=5866 RepID=A0A061D693_BABBI|nr:triose phosphate/phosphate translocator, putative [Babesia bigemina]CDR94449.1 triose phosphate/phosphate translocator, putative [Babesia bigemina]|eukprot:XP_012766635.1 triose phosphate/phosphate translocator, putative [Babesia bigemina]
MNRKPSLGILGLSKSVATRLTNADGLKFASDGVGIKSIRATRTFALPPKNEVTINNEKAIVEQGGSNINTAVVKSSVAPPVNVGRISDGNTSSAVATAKDALKSISMLSLWYAGTVMYNIENKKALNMCPLPKSIAAMQMLIGIPYFLTRWLAGIKAVPSISISNDGVEKVDPNQGVLQTIKSRVKNALARVRNTVQAYSSVLKQSAVFSMLHLLSVTALGAGAISFVHIVKASEPLFVSAISLLSGTGSMSPVTFLTLLPILGGVAMASVKDVNFNPVAFATSLASNVCASIRRIEAKKFFKQDLSKIGSNLDATNVSSLVTIISSLILAPLALLEAPQWASMYKSVLYKFGSKGLLQLARHIALSGFFYTLYNEVSFVALSQLTPVSHAVANTLKRIFLIITSSILFKTKITNMGLYGSATAITGAMLYSLSKHYMG